MQVGLTYPLSLVKFLLSGKFPEVNFPALEKWSRVGLSPRAFVEPIIMKIMLPVSH